MFRLIWAASVRTHGILSYAPTNLLLAATRTRAAEAGPFDFMPKPLDEYDLKNLLSRLLPTVGER